MTLRETIGYLKSEFLCYTSLDVVFYHYVNNNREELRQIDRSSFTGEAEKIAVSGYLEEYCEEGIVSLVETRLKHKVYRKRINIYERIGLYIYDRDRFKKTVDSYFQDKSLKYKYILTKAFPEDFKEELKRHLASFSSNQDPFLLLLQHLYLEAEVNIGLCLTYFSSSENSLDIADLLLLEDIQNIGAIGYNRLQDKLFDDIRWAANEIQRKHLNQNNSEDQYNSLFQSLLSAKDYECLDQTQSGESSGGKQPGELDILIRTSDHTPLGILEAFKLDNIDSASITRHLKKLSENYDPNGIRTNYAVIYASSSDFISLWQRYQEFVLTIDYSYELSNGFSDVSGRYPEFTDIRIGLTEHERSGQLVKVYHTFMNMRF